MFPCLVVAIIVVGLPTLYLAVRYREYRKFLAGAFFVSSGMQFYFYLAKIPIPLIWTSTVQSPELSAARHDPLRALSRLSIFRMVLSGRSPRENCCVTLEDRASLSFPRIAGLSPTCQFNCTQKINLGQQGKTAPRKVAIRPFRLITVKAAVP